MVSKLVVAAKKDPDWADALELKAVKQRRLENMIVIGTKSLQREATPLTSIKLIQDFVWDYGFTKASHAAVARVLKDYFNMSYRKVRKVAPQANSDRCLI